MHKINVLHFNNGSEGGVLTLIRTLIEGKQNRHIENHVIYTITKDRKKKFQQPQIQNLSTQNVFFYSQKWNFYTTCKNLSRYIHDSNTILVAHDWLELAMISNLGLKNPVVFVLHGDFDYYYNLAILHQRNIDIFLCVSNKIASHLKTLLENRNKKIFYLKHSVKNYYPIKKDFKKIKCAFYVNDLNDNRKQLLLLPKINEYLLEAGINIEWHIAGGGMTQNDFYKFWSNRNAIFYGKLSGSDLDDYLSHCNIFILPSLQEGFPISLVESMKNGLVPLISNWGGAVEDLVIHDFNGYYVDIGDFKTYASYLRLLYLNESKLQEMSANAISSANNQFDPIKNAFIYENIIIEHPNKSNPQKHRFKSTGSRLDNQLIPNIITFFLRNCISFIKK
jgi:glycosyltransferase involved in cell wall biosynthesis